MTVVLVSYHLYLVLFAAVDAKARADYLEETLPGDRLERSARLEGLVAAAVSAGHVGHWAAGVESGAGGAQSLTDHTPGRRDDTCNRTLLHECLILGQVQDLYTT